MTEAEPALIETASEFAAEVSDLLDRTVVDEPPIGAQVADDRVVVGAFDDDGNTVDMPLAIQGEHRLDLRASFRCTFDFTGSFLAIEQSEFALIVPTVRHPVVRFDQGLRGLAAPPARRWPAIPAVARGRHRVRDC